MHKLVFTLSLFFIFSLNAHSQTLKNGSYSTIGYIDNGTVKDASYRVIGHNEGVRPTLAVLFYFFFFY